MIHNTKNEELASERQKREVEKTYNDDDDVRGPAILPLNSAAVSSSPSAVFSSSSPTLPRPKQLIPCHSSSSSSTSPSAASSSCSLSVSTAVAADRPTAPTTTTSTTTTTINMVGGAGSCCDAQSLSAMDMDEVSFLLREQDADLLEKQESQLPNDATPKIDETTEFQRMRAAMTAPEFLLLPPPVAAEMEGHSSRLRDGHFWTTTATTTTNSDRSSHASIHLTEDPHQQQHHSQRLILPWSSLSLEGTTGDRSSAATVTTDTVCTENNSEDHNSWQTGGGKDTSHPADSFSTSAPAASLSTTHSRPTLGGQVFCEHLEEEELPSPPPLSTRNRNNSSSSSHHHVNLHNNNSDSSLMMVDRRLSEAVQFAEAIGDSKVAAELLILEEDRSDDDDDDDLLEEEEEDDTDDAHACVPPTTEEKTANSNTAGQHVGTCTSSNHGSSHHSVSFPQLPEKSGLADGRGRTRSNGSVHGSSSSSLSPYPKGRGVFRSSRMLQGHHKKRLLATKRGFLDQLPAGQVSGQSDYVYKGLHANPPEVVKRGTQRGNYAQLHRKAWLEVSDKYHRYGKNLRFYYRHWESLGCPTNMFFDWLDSKGEAAGQPLPEIQECPRAQLDADTVLYITDPEVTENYALSLIPDENGRGRVVDIDRDPVLTGPDGWIFVLRDNRFYGAQKITSVTGHQTKERFHHSSFFGGKAVAAAGIFITDEDGFLTRLYPHSGHYRPGESHIQRVLFFLHHEGVDLRSFDMDMQQILHVAREKDMVTKPANNNNTKENDPENNNNTKNNAPPPPPPKVEKKKKVESLFLTPAVLVACFLAHKARLIGAGFFEQIHQIRKSNATSVREALGLIG